MLLWLAWGIGLGLTDTAVFAWSTAWVLICAGLAYTLLQTKLNLRLRDPGMTNPIAAGAALCVVGISLALGPQLRGAVLPWLIFAFAFATYRVGPPLLARLTLFVLALLLIETAITAMIHQQWAIIAWQTMPVAVGIISSAASGSAVARARIEAAKQLRLDRTVLDSITDAVISISPTGQVMDINRVCEMILAMRRADARGRRLDELITPVDRQSQQSLADIVTRLTSMSPFTERLQIVDARQADATPLDIECSVSPVRGRRDEVFGLAVVLRDVSEVSKLVRRLEYDSSHDELTGLFNRRGLRGAITAMVDQTAGQSADRPADLARIAPERHSPAPGTGGLSGVGAPLIAALLIVDLDQFKLVNDSCGHDAGDALLKRVAATLAGLVRERGVVARYGGDEFAILLNSTHSSAAERFAEVIIGAISRLEFEWHGQRFATGASVGISLIELEHADISQALLRADSALYLAKDLGGGRVQLHQDADQHVRRKSNQLEWIARINDALQNNRFELYAQRVQAVDATNESHFEILLRLCTRDGGLALPGEFIPAAERYQLMPAIDRWVVRNVLQKLRQVRLAGRIAPRVAINLSSQSVNDSGFLPFLRDAIAASGVPADQLAFELTETVAVKNLDAARNFVRAIRALGCQFALDDVGAGFNTIATVKQMEFDAIKIDGHYIRDYDVSAADRSVVESLLRAAESMRLKTVAEMVESSAVALRLKLAGVKFLQGFAIHRPEPLLNLLGPLLSAPAPTGAARSLP